MPYVVLADLSADIPPQFLTEALDDDGDGVQDPGLWDLIAAQVTQAIDSKIGLRYPLPLPIDPETGTYFPVILNAGRVLACEKVYGRRAQTAGDKNPFKAQADAVRKQLDFISTGDLPLDPAENRKQPSASVQSSPMRTVPCGGGMMV